MDSTHSPVERPPFARIEEGWDGSPVLSLLNARRRLAARFHGPTGRYLTARGPVDTIDPVLDAVWDICHGSLWQPWYEKDLTPLLTLAGQIAPLPDSAGRESLAWTGYQDGDDLDDPRFPALLWLAEHLPWPGADVEWLEETVAERHGAPFMGTLHSHAVCMESETALVSLQPEGSTGLRVVLVDLLDDRLYWLTPADYLSLIQWLRQETMPAHPPATTMALWPMISLAL